MAVREYAAYRKAIIQTTDDKRKILLMLYDGAVKFVRNARSGIEENNPKIKGENISKVALALNEYHGHKWNCGEPYPFLASFKEKTCCKSGPHAPNCDATFHWP